MNLSYYGPMWMGTPLQKLDGIVYDTGSGKLLVESSECSNCNGTKFKVAPTSSTFQWDAVNTASAGTTYLDGTSLTGNWATDRTCPASDETSCAANFRFIAIKSQSGLKTTEDGICGMWSGQHASENTLYMTQLKAKGAVSEATFSWYMVDKSSTSYIDFGTPDASIIGDGSLVLWIPVQSKSAWWQNTLYGLKWGQNATTPGQ